MAITRQTQLSALPPVLADKALEEYLRKTVQAVGELQTLVRTQQALIDAFEPGGGTPDAHATTHESSGSDVVSIEDMAALTDVTTHNVTSTKHGFSPKSPADTTKFLRGDATPAWAVPAYPVVLDAAQTFTKAQTTALVTLTYASPTTSVDGSLSNNFQLQLTGATTALGNPTNVVAGQILNIAVRQDATGGRALTFGSAYKFPGGAPTVTSGASKEDLISCLVRTISGSTAAIMLCNIAKDHT